MSTHSWGWESLPDIDATAMSELTDEYWHTIVMGHSPTVSTQPIALTATGLVASGKSTLTQPLAESVDMVTVSTDIIREMLYRKGFNFTKARAIVMHIVSQLIRDRYNINLDFNIANDITILDECSESGYKVFIVHASPPESFIKDKITDGRLKRDLTFLGNDNTALEVMMKNKENHIKKLGELKRRYPIWREIDTSRIDLQQLIESMRRDFLAEITA